MLAVRCLNWTPRLVVILALALGTTACPGDDDDTDAGPARFIPVGDPDFEDLEQPEQAAECTSSDACEHSCVHSCIPTSALPITCPVEPPPLPPRLDGAACACDAEFGGRCAWSGP